MAPGLVLTGASTHRGQTVTGVSKHLSLHQKFGTASTIPTRAGFALPTFHSLSGLPSALAAGTAATWCARRSRQKRCLGGTRYQGPRLVQCKAHQDHENAADKLIQEVLRACTIGVATGLGVVLIFMVVLLGEHNIVASESAWAGPILGGALVTWCYYILGGESSLSGTTLADVKTLATGASNVPASLSVEERAKRSAMRSALAAVTLSTGNPLGPEGPCVEIAANVAAYFGRFGEKLTDVNSSILASGCAAGVAAGFNAPLAGIVFSLEVVKCPKEEDLTSIAKRLIAATCGAVMVQIFLGSTPPFTGVQFEDFRASSFAFGEVPLFAMLGVLCGVLTAAFDRFRGQAAALWKELPIPRTIHPLMASLFVSAVVYYGDMPFLLYKGFDNINEILTHAGDMGFMQLAMLCAAKILVSGVCVTSGLVGGVFAPALFVGATGGAMYGQGLSWLAKGVGFSHLVSSAVDYSAVGAAACLASLCGLPVSAVVLLLEVSGGANYSIVLPLMVAVGMSTFLHDYILTYVLGGNGAAKGLDGVSQRAESLFHFMDGNKDGVVTKEEFQTWYRKLNAPVQRQLELEKV